MFYSSSWILHDFTMNLFGLEKLGWSFGEDLVLSPIQESAFVNSGSELCCGLRILCLNMSYIDIKRDELLYYESMSY